MLDESQPSLLSMTSTTAQIQARVKKIREKSRTENENRVYPICPDDRRAAPNDIIRSALFGAIGRGSRRRVVDMAIPAPEGCEIIFTGWRLDQYDLDIWFEVMHLARGLPANQEITISLNGLLERLNRKHKGGADRQWLKNRLQGLVQTSVSIKYDDKRDSDRDVEGAFLSGFEIDNKTHMAVIYPSGALRKLFDYITYLDIERRRALGTNQMAKALHAVLSSHRDWYPMKVSTVMQRLGSDYSELKFFRRDLKVLLAQFEMLGWIGHWRITPYPEDLVHIELIPTPSQARSLALHPKG